MAGRDTNIGAKRAREAREAFGLDAGAPVGCLCTLVEEQLGVPVSLSAMPDGIEGLCWRLGTTTMLWVSAHAFAPRSRFTLAHELGHLRCGHDTSLVFETYSTLAGKVTTNAEIQANAFAAEFLAPRDGIRAMLDGTEPDLAQVVAVAARYGISTIAALYRLVTLKAIADDGPLKARIDASEHLPIWADLDLPEATDVLGTAVQDGLPRLSPLLAGSALAAVLNGDAAVADAADAYGGDPQVLAAALGLLGV